MFKQKHTGMISFTVYDVCYLKNVKLCYSQTIPYKKAEPLNLLLNDSLESFNVLSYNIVAVKKTIINFMRIENSSDIFTSMI